MASVEATGDILAQISGNQESSPGSCGRSCVSFVGESKQG